jgi:hypothetical protein
MSSSEPVVIQYERVENKMRFKLENITNDELGEVMIGMIVRMSREEQEDFFRKLIHYAPMIRDEQRHPDVHLSKVAAGVAQRPDLLQENRMKGRHR